MRRAALLVAAGLALTPAAAVADQTTGRLLVTLRPAAGPPHAVAAHVGARVQRAIPRLGVLTVKPRAGETLRALAHRLARDPSVASVHPERRFELRYVPDDPAFTQPGPDPGTIAEWWAARQNFPAAWDITQGGGARVAIIDTGADATHPELAGRIIESADFDDNPTHGGAGTDEVGHGTHVASLACAAPDNEVGLAGAGLDCRLLVAKSDLSEGSVAQALVWAADRGAQAINMSFGTDGGAPASGVVIDALHYAARRGAVLVAAAADSPAEEQGDPANVLQPTGTGADMTRNLGLSVTAANAMDVRAPFAGRGSQISMAAYGTFGSGPAAGLLGAFPGTPTDLERGSALPPASPCECRAVFGGDPRYANLQGTSMAAPVIAAVGALARNLNPDLSASDVVRILKTTARRPAGGWSPELGWGILDARAALAAARATDRRAPVSRLRAPRLRGRSILLRWTGADTAPPGARASGIVRYEVWRAVARAAPRRVAVTARTSLRVRGRRGVRYTFFTIAVDRAGNREAPPSRPDARVRVR